MNGLSFAILTLYHYNVLIRDTLEYALGRETYQNEAFDYKKRGLKVELEQETALKHFIDSNKEIGEKIIKEVNELLDVVYSDDSTICRKAQEGLRVDHSQHIAIYDAVLPLHEDVKKVIDAHLGFARKQNLLEDQIMKLAAADERMYRGVAFLCLYQDLIKLFSEYNKARYEAKGEITPQSNFIQGELVKITGHINFVKNNQSATDCEYWDMVDYVIKTLDQTSGRRQLPAGRKFNDIFNEGKSIIQNFLAKAEKEWKEIYEPLIKELVQKASANGGQIRTNDNGDNVTSNRNESNKGGEDSFSTDADSGKSDDVVIDDSEW